MVTSCVIEWFNNIDDINDFGITRELKSFIHQSQKLHQKTFSHLLKHLLQ